jgi:hypothetical protein
VDADPSKTRIDSADLLDLLNQVVDIVLVGKDDLLGSEAAVGIQSIKEETVHHSLEAQRVIRRKRLTLFVTVLVHEKEPAVREGQFLVADDLHQVRIAAGRTHRENQSARAACGVGASDLAGDLLGEVAVKVIEVVTDDEAASRLIHNLLG